MQQVRVKEKVSAYVEVDRTGGKNRIKTRSGKEQQYRKKKLVTFVAGVINVTHGITSKIERIHIIVKAAQHHLDMIFKMR